MAEESEAHGIAGEQLQTIVERIESVEEEIGGLNDDKKGIYGEAKANGFDVAIIKKVVSIRRKPANEVAEQNAILEMYLQAIRSPVVHAGMPRAPAPARARVREAAQ